MKVRFPWWVVVGLLAATLAVPQMATAKEMIGWVERVKLYPGDVEVDAKIDTGADSSSVNCDCIDFLEKNGVQYVSFKVTDVNGKLRTFEKKIIKHIKIKRHSGESQRRPVVNLGICVGDVYKEVQVNLTDRSGYKFPVLVGRRFLKDSFTVDPGRKHMSQPRCPDVPKDE